MSCDQEIVGSDRRSKALELPADLPIVPVDLFVQREDLQALQKDLDTLRKLR